MRNNRRQLTQNLVDAIRRSKQEGFAWVNYGNFRFKVIPWSMDLNAEYAYDNLMTKGCLIPNNPILICAKKGHLWAVRQESISSRDKAKCLLGSNIAIFPEHKNIRAFVSECYLRHST